ncbi:MAG: hypothetical protein Q9220_007345 [cf. Caloplaca sp. 1 TL-2023]
MAASQPDLQAIHDFLVSLAQKAGPMITAANPSTVDTKKNSSDLVTETDKAVEDLISSSCRSTYPHYAFLGEETSTSGRLSPEPTFVVDPIDGTTNFVHAHPYVSISMAFVYDLKPVVGVVYNPFTQHLYTAIKGQGAFLTAPTIPSSFPTAGQQVKSTYEKRKLPLRSPPAPLPDLSHALVAVEYGNERNGNNWDCKTGTFSALGRDKSVDDGAMVQSVRSLGSAALNMCSVARGDLDVYWEGGCWAWDVAAGWVIVEEAGGMVVGGNRGEWKPKIDGRRYLVLRSGAGKRVVEEFWAKPRLQDPDNFADLLSNYTDLLDPKTPSSPRYRLMFLSNAAFYPAQPTPTNNAAQNLDQFYGNIASQVSSFKSQNRPTKPAMAFGSGRVWMNFYGLKGQNLQWQDLEYLALRLQTFAKRGMQGKWRMVLWPPDKGQVILVEMALLT